MNTVENSKTPHPRPTDGFIIAARFSYLFACFFSPPATSLFPNIHFLQKWRFFWEELFLFFQRVHFGSSFSLILVGEGQHFSWAKPGSHGFQLIDDSLFLFCCCCFFWGQVSLVLFFCPTLLVFLAASTVTCRRHPVPCWRCGSCRAASERSWGSRGWGFARFRRHSRSRSSWSGRSSAWRRWWIAVRGEKHTEISRRTWWSPRQQSELQMCSFLFITCVNLFPSASELFWSLSLCFFFWWDTGI